MRARPMAGSSRAWSGAIVLGLWGLGACGSPPVRSDESTVVAEPPPAVAAEPAASASATVGWLKGQLHLHSSASGDSETPPADVARWYDEHDYDFIVFTDHNRITEIASPSSMLIFRGIELTQNLEHCEPPPEPRMACLLHVNGLFVGADTSVLARVPSPDTPDRLELFHHAVEVTEALGGIAMLNHPNFHYAADADLLAALAGRGLWMFEVANEAVDSNNAGDAAHPSTEAMWDAVLSTGARVWGIATDDAHHYYDAPQVRARGDLAHVGDRGWVMVRAERTEASIRSALTRGDFYSSNGVTLNEVSVNGTTVRVAVDEAEPSHRFVFIGDGGKVLDRQSGHHGEYTVPEDYSGYVRVLVKDRRGARAWTQPVWLR